MRVLLCHFYFQKKKNFPFKFSNFQYQKNSDESEHSIEADIVLVATGRKPFTNQLGIKELGIEVSEKGYIEIDMSGEQVQMEFMR